MLQSMTEEILLALLQSGRDAAAGVHEARKGCKQLRAWLRLLQPELGEETYAAQQGLYKQLSGELSASRDGWVRLQTWQQLQAQVPELQAETFSGITRLLTASAEQTAIPRTEPLLAQAVALEPHRFDSRAWQLPAQARQLQPALKRLQKRFTKAQQRAADSGTDEDFHRFRKRTKDLYYVLKVCKPLLNKKAGPSIKALQKITDIQGDANDLAVLKDYLQNHQQTLKLPEKSAQQLYSQIESAQQRLQQQAQKRAKKWQSAKKHKKAVRLKKDLL